jgi:hypothetical protein
MTANPAPDPPPAPVYDCFISYRSARFDWVETLARNLLTQGLRVFLDRWELVPGVDHASQLATALGRSRAGVLVASPDTVDSEWVRNEWNRMLANRHADRTDGAERPFPIIPLLLGPIPELPFASNYHSIDFSAVTDEAGYRRAFAVLLKALAGEPPGPAPHHDGPLILPPGLAAHRPPAPSQLGAIDQAAVQLRLAHLVAILAQAHYPLGRLADALARRLRDDLSAPPAEDRVLRLAPLNDPGIDAPAYFGHLATQAGLPAQGIDSAGAWRHALEVRFPPRSPQAPFALVVQDFDQGASAPRRDLAGALRAMASQGRARVAVLGGVHLAEQIYENPVHSLFRGIPVVNLDEPSAEDLTHWCAELFPGRTFLPATLNAVIQEAGGHPRLIQQALMALGTDQDWQAALTDTRPYEPLLSPYYTERERICELLRNGIDGLAQGWDPDPLVRRLYWDNLLARRGGRYAWRSPGLVRVARLLLMCTP